MNLNNRDPETWPINYEGKLELFENSNDGRVVYLKRHDSSEKDGNGGGCRSERIHTEYHLVPDKERQERRYRLVQDTWTTQGEKKQRRRFVPG